MIESDDNPELIVTRDSPPPSPWVQSLLKPIPGHAERNEAAQRRERIVSCGVDAKMAADHRGTTGRRLIFSIAAFATLALTVWFAATTANHGWRVAYLIVAGLNFYLYAWAMYRRGVHDGIDEMARRTITEFEVRK